MLKGTTRTIRNTETIRRKIKECLELLREKGKEDDDTSNFVDLKSTLENELNEEYLKFETIQSLKTFWNKNASCKNI